MKPRHGSFHSNPRLPMDRNDAPPSAAKSSLRLFDRREVRLRAKEQVFDVLASSREHLSERSIRDVHWVVGVPGRMTEQREKASKGELENLQEKSRWKLKSWNRNWLHRYRRQKVETSGTIARYADHFQN